MAQAISVLCRLISGDEESGVQIVTDIANLIHPDLVSTRVCLCPQLFGTEEA